MHVSTYTLINTRISNSLLESESIVQHLVFACTERRTAVLFSREKCFILDVGFFCSILCCHDDYLKQHVDLPLYNEYIMFLSLQAYVAKPYYFP